MNLRLNNYIRLLVQARQAEDAAAQEAAFYKDKLEKIMKKRKGKFYADPEVEAELIEVSKLIPDMQAIEKKLKGKIPKKKSKYVLVTAKIKETK